MRSTVFVSPLVALLAAVAGARAGGDDAASRAVLAKALKAHGGEENLAKCKAVTYKGAGTVHVGGDKIAFTAEWHIQGLSQQKFVIDATVMGMNFQLIKAVNGEKGYQKLGGNAVPLTKEELAEEKHNIYVFHVQQLIPLKDKAFKLAPLGEAKVNDKEAVAVCVSHKDHRDVNLYFDKATHLLVKVESRASDQGKEVNQEVFLSDYKMVDGTQQAHKMVIMHDGKVFVEAELSEVRVHVQNLDNSVFD
jgi:hypothetical protein